MADPSRDATEPRIPPDRPGGVADDPARSPGGGAWGDREAAEFARQVGGVASSGLALPGGLRAMAEEAGSGRVRGALRRVADRIEVGESLGDAIAAEGRRVPEHLIGIVRAGERAGRLPEVLAESARFERIGADLNRQILMRLAYPTLLLCAFLGVFQAIAVFVVRDYAGIYRDFGVELPALTAWLVGLSEALSRAGWAIPAAVATAGVLIWLAARGATRSNRRRVAAGVPLLGSLWRDAAMAEFASLLALLIECRLPMPEALVLAGEGVRDADLIAACAGAAGEVERGRSLADAGRSYRLFPKGLDRLVAWAEAHDALPDALRLAAEVFGARDRSQAMLIGLFATAVAVSIVLMGVILIVLGLYLPLVKLISALAMVMP